MPHKHPPQVSRRQFFAVGSALTVGALSTAAQKSVRQASLERLLRSQGDPNRRILLQGGVVLSMDPKIGDFEKGDVLIAGKRSR